MEVTKARKNACPSFEKNPSRPFHGYILYFKLYNYIKNRGFWEILEQIGALYTNIDGHSYTGVAFRKLHSKNYTEFITEFIYTEFITFMFLAQESINMNNIKSLWEK